LHAVGHHDKKGLGFACGYQIIHDQFADPDCSGGFILAPAVLQVQHRISLGWVLVVVGGV